MPGPLTLWRGFKTRLLRTPELSRAEIYRGSPRFAPMVFLTQEQGEDWPFLEVRLVPGDPLYEKISLADGIFLASAAMFSVFLSKEVVQVLRRGRAYIANYSDNEGDRWKEYWNLLAPESESDLFLKERMEDLAYEQAQFIEHLILLFKRSIDKRVQVKSRPRELVRAFRSQSMDLPKSVKAFVGGLPGYKIRIEQAREIMEQALSGKSTACKKTRALVKGYAKHNDRGGGGLTWRSNLLVFSLCSHLGNPLYYSDFSSELHKYGKLFDRDDYNNNAFDKVYTLLELTRKKGLILSPLTWWHVDKIHPPSFLEKMSMQSQLYRELLKALAGLALNLAEEIKIQPRCNPVPQLKNVLEAGMHYSYYAYADRRDARERAELIKATLNQIKSSHGLGRHALELRIYEDRVSPWKLSHVLVYGSQYPLPKKFIGGDGSSSDHIEHVFSLKESIRHVLGRKWI